jgi:hypothetical protein
MRESELREKGKALFEKQKWLVWSLSSERRMPSGLTGAPDQIVIAPDTVFLVEYKTGTGKPEPSQVDTWLRCRTFLGKHLRWVWCVGDIRTIENEIELWRKDQGHVG